LGATAGDGIELKFTGTETTLHLIRAKEEDESDGPVLDFDAPRSQPFNGRGGIVIDQHPYGAA
jgi:hypothetical protein